MKTDSKAGGAGSYHHGDLRRVLVEVALGFLEGGDLRDLSLRGIARAAGVSRAAPYHHFADREALLAAVAAEGFRRLQQVMVARLEAGDPADPLTRMQEMGVGYVLFAHGNPQLYRLMFGAEFPDRARHPELTEASAAAMAALQDAMRDSLGGRRAGGAKTEPYALTVWSLVHGLAMLLIDRRIAVDPITPEAVENLARSTTSVIGRGLRGGGGR